MKHSNSSPSHSRPSLISRRRDNAAYKSNMRVRSNDDYGCKDGMSQAIPEHGENAALKTIVHHKAPQSDSSANNRCLIEKNTTDNSSEIGEDDVSSATAQSQPLQRQQQDDDGNIRHVKISSNNRDNQTETAAVHQSDTIVKEISRVHHVNADGHYRETEQEILAETDHIHVEIAKESVKDDDGDDVVLCDDESREEIVPAVIGSVIVRRNVKPVQKSKTMSMPMPVPVPVQPPAVKPSPPQLSQTEGKWASMNHQLDLHHE